MPRAQTREFSVGCVCVRGSLPVGVDLVRDEPRRLVVEPAGDVAVRKRLVAVGRHRDLVAVDVVTVVDGIRRAALGEDATFRVVGCVDDVRERIDYGNLPPERVVAVGCLVAERVDGLGDAALRVVDDLRAAAASVGLR